MCTCIQRIQFTKYWLFYFVILDFMYCICNLDWFKLILELDPVRIRSLTHTRIRRPSILDPDPQPRPSTLDLDPQPSTPLLDPVPRPRSLTRFHDTHTHITHTHAHTHTLTLSLTHTLTLTLTHTHTLTHTQTHPNTL